VLECVSGEPRTLPSPESGFQVPSALAAIIAAGPQRHSGHIITGPVAVAGAEPGDMLEVRIDQIDFGADWGFCGIYPLAGTLPDDFPYTDIAHIPIDTARRTCRMAHGTELPLAPFFGVMGVAPPAAYGPISTIPPREHGGNLDNRELVAGSTLFLPVWAPGALFSAGDGHGLQGDGEVCVNALETCLTGTFTLILHRRPGSDPLLRYPRAETPTHFIAMGMDRSLDGAMKKALREMIAFIRGRTNLSDADAYRFCSLAVDFRVTQTVNGEQGIHAMLRRGLLF
jgi:acetamidase/formamidase